VRTTVTDWSHRLAPSMAPDGEMVVPSDGPDSRATAVQAIGTAQAAATTSSLRVRDIAIHGVAEPTPADPNAQPGTAA